MIVSANLNKEAERIYRQINKLRKYGWFSKDVQEMLQKKYGNEKNKLLTRMSDLDKEEEKITNEKQDIAKKLNKLK